MPSFTASNSIDIVGSQVVSGGLSVGTVAQGSEVTSGLRIFNGGLTVSQGGATITSGGLTVSADGMSVTGTSTITGGLTATVSAASPYFSASGLNTAVNSGARFVGATSSGAPISGTYTAGDFIVDQSGKLWIYNSSAAWVQVGASTSKTLTIGNGLLGSISTFNGGQDVTISLPTVGTSGTYKSVTTDAYGRVSSGSNPTTLSGFGITDGASILTTNSWTATQIFSNSTDGIILGGGDGTGTPTASKIRAASGTGTNIAGTSLSIVAGASTGTGTGGSILFYTSESGTTGTTANAAAERVKIVAGSGNVGIGLGSANSPQRALDIAGTLRLNGTTVGTNYTEIQSAAAPTANVTYTLPAAGPSSNGYVLSSTTAGVMSWVANGSGGGGTTTYSLLIGSNLTGTSFNGSSEVTIALSATPSSITSINGITVSGTSGTFALRGDQLYIGTTAVALNRATANLALDGITGITMPGSTSGSVQIIPSATAGTGTTFTLPATSGIAITNNDSGTVTNTMLAGSIANTKLANSSVTINTTSISLGGSATITAVNPYALAIGSGLSGSSYDGSSGVTIALNLGTANTWTATQTFSHATSAVFGSGDGTGTITGGLLRAPSGAGTNIAGGLLTIAGGASTGTGAGGSISFQTASAGTSSGTSANSLVERMSITSTGKIILNNSIQYVAPTYGGTTASGARKSYNDGNDPTVISVSFTVSAALNKCLVIAVANNGTSSFTATWVVNGQTYNFTTFATQTTNTGTRIMYLVNPANGTGTVNIYPSPTTYWEAGVFLFTGVNQATPFVSAASTTVTIASNQTGSATINYTGAAGNVTIGVNAFYNNANPTSYSGSMLFAADSDGGHRGAAQYKTTTVGSDSLSWTFGNAVRTGGCDNNILIAQLQSASTSASIISTQPGVQLNLEPAAASAWTFPSVTETLNINANLLVLDAQNRYVGIGTNTPTSELEVNGKVTATTSAISSNIAIGGTIDTSTPLRIASVSATGQIGAEITTTSGGHLLFTDVGNINMSLGVLNGVSGLSFHANRNQSAAGTELMRLSSNGYLGINQTTPGSHLDVKGTIRLSGSSSGYVGLVSSASAGSTTYTLPSSAPTSNTDVLSSTTSGTMTWVPVILSKTYNFVGTITVATGSTRWYPDAAISLQSMMLGTSTSPSGGSFSITLNKNGSSVGTATISSGQFYSSLVTLTATLLSTDYLTVDVSAANGATNGYLTILYKRT